MGTGWRMAFWLEEWEMMRCGHRNLPICDFWSILFAHEAVDRVVPMR